MSNDPVLRLIALFALINVLYLVDHTRGAKNSHYAVSSEMVKIDDDASVVANDSRGTVFIREDLLNRSGVRHAGSCLVILLIAAAYRAVKINKNHKPNQEIQAVAANRGSA